MQQHTSHDNPSYQTIPPEFITHSTRSDSNQRPKTREKLSSMKGQNDLGLATPNCILLTVGLLLIIIVVTMMVFMDSVDTVAIL